MEINLWNEWNITFCECAKRGLKIVRVGHNSEKSYRHKLLR